MPVTDLPPERPELTDDDIDIEVVEHEPALTERSTARRAALQALYEIDAASHDLNLVIAHRLEHKPLAKKEANYMRRLVSGVVGHLVALDEVISRFAPEWPLDQVAIVDRNILRLATYELASRQSIPVNVIVAEAIELAQLYGADGTPRFVNGVLGAMAQDMNSLQGIVPQEPEIETES
ncbi:MAG: transcription antitermination factor NusB [Anaerolineae bacterium]|nr:transcription antitermination factor NusB [Anaerolineae bacterium]